MENKSLKNAIEWTAYEYQYVPKSTSWHIAYSIMSALLIGYAVYSRSLMTIITFVVLSVVGWLFAIRKPKKMLYGLSTTGVVMDTTSIPYKNIKNFWILYKPPHVKTLNFETTAYLNRTVSIELGNQDPLEVKRFLQNYLLEDLDREESLTDIIARHIKF